MAERDLSALRKEISHELGSETIASLHAQSWFFDVLTMIAFPAVNAAIAIYLGTAHFNPIWVALFVLQGTIIPAYLSVGHDLFMHRRFGGRIGSAILGFIYFLPILFPFQWFVAFHRQHHKYVGSESDSEEYKQDVNTRWKKLLFMTVPGVKIIMSRRLAPVPPDPRAALKATAEELKWIRIEKILLRIYIVLLAIAAYKSRIVFYGVVLPFITVSPIMSQIRVILEHGEANPNNPFQMGTLHRANLLLSIIFVFSLGEEHNAHHIFQGIPWYRLRRASTLMRPILVRHGCVFRPSFAALLWGWFVKNEQHRSMWSPPEAESAPAAPRSTASSAATG